jgi:glutaminase
MMTAVTQHDHAARRFASLTTLVTLSFVALAPRSIAAQTAPEYQRIVNAAYEKYKNLQEGKNADYIPALAKVNPALFGIALITPEGQVYTAGDVTSEVSIQSVSKVFTMARVMQDSGDAAVEKNTGVDATGQAFNSIIAIEQHKGHEMNPLVNAGAITTTSMIGGGSANAVWSNIMNTLNEFAGRQLNVNQEVYKSEAATNQRNQAIGALMYAYGHISGDWRQAVDLYTRQCSVNVNAKDLATMAATLANGGLNPVTGHQVVGNQHVPGILAVMATAGLYDNTGEWLFMTGLPAKSGVGGGLIAVSPDRFGIAVVSPPLDSAGNSVRGQKAIADISAALHGNPFISQAHNMVAKKR